MDASASRRIPDEPPPDSPSWKEVLDSLIERLGEIREYSSYYVSTKTDAVRNKLTWIAIYAALGVVAAVIGLAVLATLGVMLISGIAGGFGELFGRAWLGQLVTAAGLLLVLGLGVMVGLKVLQRSVKRKLMARYEQRHQEQRRRYGSDVVQRSSERERQEIA